MSPCILFFFSFLENTTNTSTSLVRGMIISVHCLRIARLALGFQKMSLYTELLEQRVGL